MQNIIVGTAGHVDHGKTCLIKALSGFDTDRLKEEKKRGIINLRLTCSLKPWRKNSPITLPCGNTIFSSKRPARQQNRF